MKLNTLFPLIVGQLMTSTLGLTSCAIPGGGGYGERSRGPYCSDERMSDIVWVTDETEQFNAAFDAALDAFERDHPDATPAETLHALYANQAAAIHAQDESNYPLRLNTKARDLLLASMDSPGGRVSPEMCQLLCQNVLGFYQHDECSISEQSGEEARDMFECAGVVQICHPAGRRFEGMGGEVRVGGEALGRAWAHIAFAERAAVHAFALLAEELAFHGAPRALVEGCIDALVDEVAHSQMTSAMARRHGADAVAPVTEAGSRAPRPLLEIALENAQEGCVRESYAALETTWQGQRADDPAARDIFARIASDETRHAELSWDLHAWIMELLPQTDRARVHAAMEHSLEALAEELTQRTSEMMHPALGLPDTTTAQALLAELERHTLAA